MVQLKSWFGGTRSGDFPVLVQLAAAAVVVIVVAAADGVAAAIVVVAAVQVLCPAQVDDLVMFRLEMEGQVAAFAPKSAEGALQGPAEVLHLLPVVDGHQESAHFRILSL